ncbi:MAG: IclR family transcriptional regulator [Opitutales bacterium]|nr:IclR family transcriptional regulator [Opitutales bacterium]
MPDYTIPNLKNACRLLHALSLEGEPSTIAELADRLTIPRSTTLRILATLEDQQFIRRVGKRYHLGVALIPLGRAATGQHSQREHIVPVLQWVSRETDETCHFVQRVAEHILILHVCESPHPMSAHSSEGSLADLYCSATGKAILAHMPRADAMSILSRVELKNRTGKTLTSLDALGLAFDEIARQGYSIDEQEYHEGIRCMAVPVFSDLNTCMHSIGITASTSRFTRNRFAAVHRVLLKARGQLEDVFRLQLRK